MESQPGAQRVIGIDLGTTNSCLATLEHGQASVINNAEGERTTPSVVSFLDSGERIVGQAARRQAVIHPERTIASAKRLIGRKRSELSSELESLPYSVSAGENDAARIELGESSLSPEEVSAMVLGKLKADAEAFTGEQVSQVVVTVPAYFNDAQRKATEAAAKIAGLEVLRLINEPTAAALAYGFNEEREETLLVFDLGGGTFDVSVLEIGDGVFEVLATAGDNRLGGDDFDRAIVEHLTAEFKAESGVDLALVPEALQRLYEAAERAKVELSSMPEVEVSLPFIAANDGQPLHLKASLNRATLSKIIAPLLDRLVGPTQQALKDAGLEASEVDHVLLVGGMTRMPAVQEKVKDLAGKEPHKGVNPDEAVALGAAIQAGIILGQVEDVLLLDVIPMTLGIETKGGVMTRLIEANTTIPTKFTQIFTTAEDKQVSVEVHVLQGEREFAADNRSLGRVQLLGIPPAIASEPQIEVSFDIDANGILHVSARDLGTGNKTAHRIEATTTLSDVEITQMREDAERHRDEDRRRRHEVEARNDASITCQQAFAALERNGERMTEDERTSVQKFLTELEQLVSSPEADFTILQSTREQLLEALQVFTRRAYDQEVIEEAIDQAPGLSEAIAPEGEAVSAEEIADAEIVELDDLDEEIELELAPQERP